MKKKVVSVLLVAAMVASMTGCGGNDAGTSDAGTSDAGTSDAGSVDAGTADTGAAEGDDAAASDVEKPEEITIMFDGTVPTAENGQEQFIAKLEELTGIKINVIQPDHDAYYDVVGQQIAGGDWPDVLILASTQMSSYGAEGVLWDMADAWNSSELKTRQEAYNGAGVVESMFIDGHLYGMPATHGNGCVTYIKQKWLDDAGITSLPTTFDEYYEDLKKMKEAESVDYVLAASGFLNAEAPYINYLPEFYQDAWPTFYQKEDGTWADGFTEDSMKAAMERIAQGVKDGIIDPETNSYATSDVRNKFYDDSLGVFTYWAGTWATNIKTNCENNGLDGTMAVMEPIAEIKAGVQGQHDNAGGYIDRVSPAWCITTQCENPEGVFKYFIEAMQDGADTQFLWTYGVEGVHWSTAAETLYAGTEDEKVYADGEFHMEDNLETPGTQYTKAHIDPMLALTELANDPRDTTVQPEAMAAQELFNSNSVGAFVTPSTDVMNEKNGDLMTEKQALVAKVALGQMTVDEAYAEYESGGYAQMSQDIVDSLNAQ